jgi:hypothetical protein
MTVPNFVKIDTSFKYWKGGHTDNMEIFPLILPLLAKKERRGKKGIK